MIEDLLTDYKINDKKSFDRVERNARYLKKFFSGMKAAAITTPKVKDYIKKRMGEGKKNATINRELAALKRMFSLGAKYTPPKVSHISYIPMLKENNVRKGFFEYENFLNLREKLPAYLYGFCTFAYKAGWRYGEIKSPTWSQVDRTNGIVVLNPGETKNDGARTFYLDEELKEIFKQLWLNRQLGCAYVFHLQGKPIGDFRCSWDKATKKAGLAGMLFHDHRRTVVRNLVRAGVPETVAMKISGHKTRSVFDRYNITSENDLKEAARKQEEYLSFQLQRLQNGYNLQNFTKKGISSNQLTP